jgi:diacylglycerol O-acyltransferase
VANIEAAHRERMSSVDTTWLRMDRPGNLMVIVGIMVFDRPVDRRKLKALLASRLLAFPRFRQCVQTDASGAAWWVDDAHFDLDAHLVHSRLAPPADDAALQTLVAQRAVTPLDPQRPLWQFEVVEGYRGTSALVARIHHCIADGIALIRVLLSLTDDAPRASTEPSTRRVAQAARRRSSRLLWPPMFRRPTSDTEAGDPTADGLGQTMLSSNPWQMLLQPLTERAVQAIGAAGQVVTGSMQLATRPDRLGGYAQVGQRAVADAVQLALMPADTLTRLKGTVGPHKRVAWNEPLPLDDVKLVGRALQASVNDVLLSCVAGALRRYLIAQGEDTEGCQIRAMVPVNLRPASAGLELGNRFGLVPLVLPVGMVNPVARLQEVRRRMDALKGGYQALITYGLLAAVGHAPRAVQDPILQFMANKTTAVMTNVPGPGAPMSMAGRTLSRMMFWVPQSGDVGLGVSILSYAGGVQFGVIADAGFCPDPQQLIDAFAPEFEQLLLLAAVLPQDARGQGELDAQRLEAALFGA